MVVPVTTLIQLQKRCAVGPIRSVALQAIHWPWETLKLILAVADTVNERLARTPTSQACWNNCRMVMAFAPLLTMRFLG
jgi:hypothetical protein